MKRRADSSLQNIDKFFKTVQSRIPTTQKSKSSNPTSTLTTKTVKPTSVSSNSSPISTATPADISAKTTEKTNDSYLKEPIPIDPSDGQGVAIYEVQKKPFQSQLLTFLKTKITVDLLRVGIHIIIGLNIAQNLTERFATTAVYLLI